MITTAYIYSNIISKINLLKDAVVGVNRFMSGKDSKTLNGDDLCEPSSVSTLSMLNFVRYEFILDVLHIDIPSQLIVFSLAC
jgi:hypothetical protein